MCVDVVRSIMILRWTKNCLYLKTLFKSTCEWGIVYNLKIQCPLGRTYLNRCLNTCVFNCVCMHTQSCLTLCNPIDCIPQGSSVHGISQARILEWVAISFSRASSQSRDRTLVSWISCIGRQVLYQLSHRGNPKSSILPLIIGHIKFKLNWFFLIVRKLRTWKGASRLHTFMPGIVDRKGHWEFRVERKTCGSLPVLRMEVLACTHSNILSQG